jgi:taurine dioxygenase
MVSGITSRRLVTSGPQLDIQPISAYLGADILNLDLGAVAMEAYPAVVEALKRALDIHLMIRLRNQHLAPEQMERLGGYFGPFLSLKRPESRDTEHIPGLRFLKIISNARTPDGRPLGDGSAAEQDWHTDGAMKPLPATYSHMYARVVPPDPPRTCWMNMYLVYASLPPRLRRAIAGLKVIHHHYSAGNEFPLPPTLPLERRLAGPQHPLARVHPATGRPMLYLPHRDDALVVGMDAAQSRELIVELRRFAAGATCWWGTTLQSDDLVIWDNRPCLHRREGWDPAQERTVWHLSNEGEAPIPYQERADSGIEG